MYCQSCGANNKDTVIYCEQCGKPLKASQNSSNDWRYPQRAEGSVPKSNTLAIISLVFAILFPFIGLIMSIVAVMKYPKNTTGNTISKTAFWISLILFIISIIFIL